MVRRHAAVAVVAVALLALLGTATPVAATNGTATTTDSTPGAETPAGDATVELATDGGAVVLRPASDQTVRGRTSLPRGTELTIRMRSSGERPFLKTRTVTVGQDGTFAATFDFDGFAENAPVEAVVSVRTAGGELEREYEGVIRSATGSPTTVTDTTSVNTPGFGALSAGVAAAALVAVALARPRRTD